MKVDFFLKISSELNACYTQTLLTCDWLAVRSYNLEEHFFCATLVSASLYMSNK